MPTRAIHSFRIVRLTCLQLPIGSVKGNPHQVFRKPFATFYSSSDCYAHFQDYSAEPLAPRFSKSLSIRGAPLQGYPFISHVGHLVADTRLFPWSTYVNLPGVSVYTGHGLAKSKLSTILEDIPKLSETDLRFLHIPLAIRRARTFACEKPLLGMHAFIKAFVHIYPYGAVVIETSISVVSPKALSISQIAETAQRCLHSKSSKETFAFPFAGNRLSFQQFEFAVEEQTLKALLLTPAIRHRLQNRLRFTFVRLSVAMPKQANERLARILNQKTDKAAQMTLKRASERVVLLGRTAVINLERPRGEIQHAQFNDWTSTFRKFEHIAEFCLCKLALYQAMQLYVSDRVLELKQLARRPLKKILSEDVFRNQGAIVQQVEEQLAFMDRWHSPLDTRFQRWFHIVSASIGLDTIRRTLRQDVIEYGKEAKDWQHPIPFFLEKVLKPLSVLVKPKK